MPAASHAIANSAPMKFRPGVELANLCVKARATRLSDWMWSVTLQVASSLAHA
jgi:hypothetical protein